MNTGIGVDNFSRNRRYSEGDVIYRGRKVDVERGARRDRSLDREASSDEVYEGLDFGFRDVSVSGGSFCGKDKGRKYGITIDYSHMSIFYFNKLKSLYERSEVKRNIQEIKDLVESEVNYNFLLEVFEKGGIDSILEVALKKRDFSDFTLAEFKQFGIYICRWFDLMSTDQQSRLNEFAFTLLKLFYVEFERRWVSLDYETRDYREIQMLKECSKKDMLEGVKKFGANGNKEIEEGIFSIHKEVTKIESLEQLFEKLKNDLMFQYLLQRSMSIEILNEVFTTRRTFDGFKVEQYRDLGRAGLLLYFYGKDFENDDSVHLSLEFQDFAKLFLSFVYERLEEEELKFYIGDVVAA